MMDKTDIVPGVPRIMPLEITLNPELKKFQLPPPLINIPDSPSKITEQFRGLCMTI